MNRRNFLKSLAGAAAVAVVPVPAGAQAFAVAEAAAPAVAPAATGSLTVYASMSDEMSAIVAEELGKRMALTRDMIAYGVPKNAGMA